MNKHVKILPTQAVQAVQECVDNFHCQYQSSSSVSMTYLPM